MASKKILFSGWHKSRAIVIGILVVLIIISSIVYTSVRFGWLNIGADFTKVAIYKVSPFDKILPETNVSSAATTSIDVDLYKNELGSFSLALKNTSGKNLNITVDPTQFSSAAKTIQATTIDSRVVNVWDQKIINWSFPRTTHKETVPELLVKNDRRDYANFSIRNVANTNIVNIGALTKLLLQVPSSEKVDTIIPAGKTKQFIFKTSKINGAGTFKGYIKFSEKTTKANLATVKVNLNVKNIALVQPSDAGYNIGCYYNDSLAYRKTTTIDRFEGKDYDRVDPYYLNPGGISDDTALLTKRLKMIKDYGCNSLRIIADPYTDTLGGVSHTAKYIKLIRSEGFTGPIFILFGKNDVIQGEPVELPDDTKSTGSSWGSPSEIFKSLIKNVKLANTGKQPIVFYGIDEPNNNTLYQNHKTKIDNIRKAIAEVDAENPSLASVPPLASSLGMTSSQTHIFSRLKSENYLPEYPYENIQSSSESNINDLTTSAAYRDKASVYPNEGYYFQGINEDPKMNRFLGGLFLTGTNLYGYLINNIYAYGGLAPNNSSNLERREASRYVYNDFFGNDWTLKRANIFYPSGDGFIPTIQSEAWREGVMDIRVYLTAKAKAELAESKCPAVKTMGYPSKIEAIQSQYKSTNPKFGYDTIPLSSAQMEINRSNLDSILAAIAVKCPAAF